MKSPPFFFFFFFGLKQYTMEACLLGNLRQRERMASTTTTLNSSEISDMKPSICFIKRSTDASVPVLSSVVMARVEIVRLASVIRFSMSTLHAATM